MFPVGICLRSIQTGPKWHAAAGAADSGFQINRNAGIKHHDVLSVFTDDSPKLYSVSVSVFRFFLCNISSTEKGGKGSAGEDRPVF